MVMKVMSTFAASLVVVRACHQGVWCVMACRPADPQPHIEVCGDKQLAVSKPPGQ